MIHIAIANARIEPSSDGTSWWVMHPSNDAILAYCDTRGEADAFVAALDAMRLLILLAQGAGESK